MFDRLLILFSGDVPILHFREVLVDGVFDACGERERERRMGNENRGEKEK